MIYLAFTDILFYWIVILLKTYSYLTITDILFYWIVILLKTYSYLTITDILFYWIVILLKTYSVFTFLFPPDWDIVVVTTSAQWTSSKTQM